MNTISFYYTHDQQEAATWHLDFKLISDEGDIFYTARIFFKPFPNSKSCIPHEYYNRLFTTAMKENIDNTLRLPLSTSALDKYLLFLKLGYINNKDLVKINDEDIMMLINIADQQNIPILIEKLLPLAAKQRIITADHFFHLINTNNIVPEFSPSDLLHLDGILDNLHHFEVNVLLHLFENLLIDLFSRTKYPSTHLQPSNICLMIMAIFTTIRQEKKDSLNFLHKMKSDLHYKCEGFEIESYGLFYKILRSGVLQNGVKDLITDHLAMYDKITSWDELQLELNNLLTSRLQ